MTKLDGFLEKLNFKKLVRVYIIISVLLIVSCSIITFYISRDKINLAFNYKKVSHEFDKNGMNDNLKPQLMKLASTSKDIKNILVVDKNDRIIYQVNNQIILNAKEFKFTPYSYYRNYLQDNINKNIIYKVDRDKDLILNRDYIKNHREIEQEIDDSFSFQMDLGANKIYLLNYLYDENTGTKLFLIREVSAIPYLEDMLEVIGLIFGIIFAIYWIGLALWVYRDANRRRCNSALWGLLVLISNIAGFIVYIMFKQSSTVCSSCGSLQNKENKFCSYCGIKLCKTCNNCSSNVSEDDHYCGNCGQKL